MDCVLVVDPGLPGCPVVAVTQSAEELTGFPVEELVGRPWPPVWDAERDAGSVGALGDALARGVRVTVAVPTVRRAAEPLDTVVSASPASLDGRPVVFLEVTRSVGERERWLAYHDALTGLANRHLLERDLDLALSRAARHGAAVALLYLDLDGFKAVNDELGHAAGDEVLREVASRLRALVRSHDLVVRLGGDEFAVVLTDLGEAPGERAAVVAGHLRGVLAEPVVLAEGPRRVTASIGVSVFPADAPDSAALLASADARMYRAKEAGRAPGGRPTAVVSEARERLLARARDAQERSQRLRPVTRASVDAAAEATARTRARRERFDDFP